MRMKLTVFGDQARELSEKLGLAESQTVNRPITFIRKNIEGHDKIEICFEV